MWDLEPVSQSELPPQLSPIQADSDNRPVESVDEIDWGRGRHSPPTALGYQTVDQLSPIPAEPTVRDSQTNTPVRRSLRKVCSMFTCYSINNSECII